MSWIDHPAIHHLSVVRLPTGPSANDREGGSERERERDRGPSSVGSEPPLHDARTRGGQRKSGDRQEDRRRRRGARGSKTAKLEGRGRDEVETRRRRQRYSRVEDVEGRR